MRSTTENVAGIASMAKALRMVTEKETLALPRLKAMREVIYQALSGYQDVTLFSGQEGFAPNIITFGIMVFEVKSLSMLLKRTTFIFRQPALVRLKLESRQEVW